MITSSHGRSIRTCLVFLADVVPVSVQLDDSGLHDCRTRARRAARAACFCVLRVRRECH